MKETIQLQIHDLNSSGEGVGKIDGYPYFIEGALPGETVEAEILLRKKTYAKGNLLRVIEASPERREAPCPFFATCGGCQIMHLSYPGQLEIKRKRVEDAMTRIGKLTDVSVLPCLPSPQEYHYRNKIQAPAGNGKIGFYRKRSHDIVDVDHCLIHCESGDRIYSAIRDLLKRYEISFYDDATGKGLIRFVLLRTAVQTDQVLVTFVTSGPVPKALSDLSQELLANQPNVQGVVANVNRKPGNTVLGSEWHLLAGQDRILETIGPHQFSVSPASFFQVNPFQAEKLYEEVIRLIEPTADMTVIDAFCGVGTMTLRVAEMVKQAIGIECIPEAVADAKENAARNNVSNATFVCGKAEETLQKLDPADCVILNPPRKGCEPSLLAALGRQRPKKILYVSCDPATLARDLALLVKRGYVVDHLQPFDMFPQTSHVETVARLTTL